MYFLNHFNLYIVYYFKYICNHPKIKHVKRIYFLFVSLFLLVSTYTYSQDFPTRGEIYDYEVGDEFHFIEIDNLSGEVLEAIENIKILDKYYIEAEDKVIYIQLIKRLDFTISFPDSIYLEVFDTVTYGNLSFTFISDSIFEDLNWYNGRTTILSQYEGMMSIESFMHSVGLGQIYYEFIDYNPDYLSDDFKELVYFKKGDEEWGEAQTIVGLDEISNENEIHLFPNPASDYINISTNEKAEIQIYNSTGQLLLRQKANSDNTQADVSAFPAGIYFANLLDEEGLNIRKLKFLKK